MIASCICGGDFELKSKGRPRKYCSDTCRLRARREGVQQPLVRREVVGGRLYCTACTTEKPVTEFNPAKRYAAGYQAWCRECYRAYNVARRDQQRRNERFSRYGISIKDQIDLIVNQAYRCAACREPITEESAHLDHCHTTGRVRGFLCQPCNLVIGFAGENEDRLIECAAYLAGQDEMTLVRLVSEVSHS